MSSPDSAALSAPSAAPQPPLAIVTGGSRGLGYEVARGLAAQGYHLSLIAQHEDGLATAREKLLRDFPGAKVATHAIDFDISKPGQLGRVRQQLNDLKSALVTPSVLVIAHGVMSEKMSKTLRTTDT
ncbi:MAG: SDR family NAD(P)-dependent oxidoreductase, partial [Mycobacterium sp.]